jgi:hypothetical protein
MHSEPIAVSVKISAIIPLRLRAAAAGSGLQVSSMQTPPEFGHVSFGQHCSSMSPQASHNPPSQKRLSLPQV